MSDWKSAHDPKPERCKSENTVRGEGTYKCERERNHPGPHAADPWDDWGPRYWNDTAPGDDGR